MAPSKHYSNAFTKHVDYEGGRHRGRLAHDEPLVCRDCGSFYLKRRWVRAEDPRAALIPAEATRVQCPACEAKAKHIISGYLTMSGTFLAQHRDEIVRLIENEANRAADDNPTGRIMGWDDKTPGELTVTTTTEHLVERLGRALKHAFGGAIDYGFSHNNKLARATWARND